MPLLAPQRSLIIVVFSESGQIAALVTKMSNLKNNLTPSPEVGRNKMSASEMRASFSLAALFSLRMLGLFMIYPVFALYSRELTGATPSTVGLALGGYGLTQAVFQIPFGLWSDRLGRRPVIAFGLLLFAGGSVLAALSSSIYGVIAGRILQGSGAVGSTILALGADVTREEQRTKMMAFIGISIGLSFGVAIVIGPVINHWVGVSGIFWLTALLALAGIGILFLAVPKPKQVRIHRDVEPVPAQFRKVLRDSQLLRLDFGIFALHTILTAGFLVFPRLLQEAGVSPSRQWQIYLPVLLGSALLMFPLIRLAEEKKRVKEVFLTAILVLILVQPLLWESQGALWMISTTLLLFFAAFNLMEASLPSLISRLAPAECKGTAMGIYSSFQFLGVFAGGALGGRILGTWGTGGIFAFSGIVASLWLVSALSMKSPRYLDSYLLKTGPLNSGQAQQLCRRLKGLPGVAEAVFVAEEGVAYLKVDPRVIDEKQLHSFSVSE